MTAYTRQDLSIMQAWPLDCKVQGPLVNTIYNVDCMDLLLSIPDGYASLILTDPPYGIRYQNQFTSRPHPHLMGDSGFDYMRFAAESYRILRNNAHAYFFTRFDCYPHHYECLRRAGFTIKNCLVIEKGTVGGIGDLGGSFANNSEWLIFCQKGRRIFNRTSLLQNRKKEGTRPQANRRPSQRYKTRFNACWFGGEYPKATYGGRVRYFTDNPLERLMMQRPRSGGEGKPLPAPQGHFCHGCKRYGDKCVRPCYRDMKADPFGPASPRSSRNSG